MSEKQMRVLITGANGFIGKHCVDLFLQSGISILCLCKNKTTQAQHAIQCDLYDYTSIDTYIQSYNPTHLLHLAWISDQDYATSTSNMLFLDATIHLVHSFFENGGQRFIGVGTCFEYAQTNTPCKEHDTATIPVTLYGKSKLAVANYVSAYATAYKASYAWCRPFYLLGPGESMRRLVPSVCSSFIRKVPFHTQSLYHYFDYMDVRDAAQALFAVVLSEFTGCVNIASGTGIYVKEIINKLAVLTNTQHTFVCKNSLRNRQSIVANTDILQKQLHFYPRYTIDESLFDCFNDIKGRL